jgi:hypothetical protein
MHVCIVIGCKLNCRSSMSPHGLGGQVEVGEVLTASIPAPGSPVTSHKFEYFEVVAEYARLCLQARLNDSKPV